MRSFPTTPPISKAPEGLLASGHLWILEVIDGLPLRFQLQESGFIRFGDRSRVVDDPDQLPAAYGAAVRHIRDELDREALRGAVDAVEDIVFFGTATVRRTLPYEIDAMPPFLGSDIRSAKTTRFRPPDAADGIFRRLGLDPVNAFEQEFRARDFPPGSYMVPSSAWYDGPAKGVILRNKRGQRGQQLHPDTAQSADAQRAVTEEVTGPSASALAARSVTPQRIASITDTLERQGRPVTVDAVYERLVERALREAYSQLCGEASTIDLLAFRSEVAARTQEYLTQ